MHLVGEIDAAAAATVAGEEVHRYAEQQREKHHRRAIELSQEGGSGRDHAARQDDWREFAPAIRSRHHCREGHRPQGVGSL